MHNGFEEIPSELFAFANASPAKEVCQDSARGRTYLSDAFNRFRKNGSSVAGGIIIAVLVLFAIFSPIASPYSVYDKDKIYSNYPPFSELTASLGIGGFLDGSDLRRGQNTLQIDKLSAIAEETGYDPVASTPRVSETVEIYRGEERTVYSYSLRVNRYYERGVVFKLLSEEEFRDIQEWQNETGIQVIYPYVRQSDIYDIESSADIMPKRDGNIWYRCASYKGEPLLDSDGNRIPAYSSDKELEGAEYSSLRVPSDKGDYIYSMIKSGAIEARISYYNYYKYLNGHSPMYLMGTDEYGRDLLASLGTGARFSLVFALLVSFINLLIGVVYGAVQGYYGGGIDLFMDRVSDIIYGVPFIVVATLFQLHLASRVGIVPSFLFAFVLSGWIGMASLTRKQFYRFKGREYVLASKTLGARDSRLMFKHILPNAIGTIITSAVLIIPGVISSEATLSYLGIVNLSEFSGTSIGELMASGQQSMTSAPHTMLFVGLFVSVLLISFNLFGNGLRDALNPMARGD